MKNQLNMNILTVCLFGLLTLISSTCGAPVEERIETDPELTAGYYQGDIVLGVEMRNGVRDRLWPNKTVYYKFYHNFDKEHKDLILSAMDMIKNNSCVRFSEATPETPGFINITAMHHGCFSNIGYNNNAQIFNLKDEPIGTGCFRLGSIMHELLHTLGFYHMHTAENRDQYVRIIKKNISPISMSQFYIQPSNDYGVEYDYGSVMHYSRTALSINGENTIEPLHNTSVNLEIMGQRDHISVSDLRKVNLMYSCT